MGNHQSNQPRLKSSEVSVARPFSPLIVGVILCWLSFLYDKSVIQWVKAHELKPVKEVAGFLSNWGDWPELMLFACIGLGFACLAQSRAVCKFLLCMMIAATISGAVATSLRFLTGRARPNNTEATQEWNGLWRGREFLFLKNKYHSFPSGHTGVAFAFFGVAFFANRRYGWWALLAASANAWSRIYLNVHHLSDIMVGALIGLVIASLVWEYLEPQVGRFLGHFSPARVLPPK
jgi:membrane-associated phospholipid phosphatase